MTKKGTFLERREAKLLVLIIALPDDAATQGKIEELQLKSLLS